MQRDPITEKIDEHFPDAVTCANCVHGKRSYPVSKILSLQTLITCKAMPPSSVGVPVQDKRTGAVGLEVKAVWPTVGPNDWCGCFERRQESKTAS